MPVPFHAAYISYHENQNFFFPLIEKKKKLRLKLKAKKKIDQNENST